MGVEMDQSDRTALLGDGAQQGKSDGVVAAQGDQMVIGRRLLLDQIEAFLDPAQRDLEIADIGDRQMQGIAPIGRIVAIDQHAAGMTNRMGSEARPRAVGHRDVEGRAGDADLGVLGIALGAQESVRNSEGRRAAHDRGLEYLCGWKVGLIHRPRGRGNQMKADDGGESPPGGPSARPSRKAAGKAVKHIPAAEGILRGCAAHPALGRLRRNRQGGRKSHAPSPETSPDWELPCRPNRRATKRRPPPLQPRAGRYRHRPVFGESYPLT